MHARYSKFSLIKARHLDSSTFYHHNWVIEPCLFVLLNISLKLNWSFPLPQYCLLISCLHYYNNLSGFLGSGFIPLYLYHLWAMKTKLSFTMHIRHSTMCLVIFTSLIPTPPHCVLSTLAKLKLPCNSKYALPLHVRSIIPFLPASSSPPLKISACYIQTILYDSTQKTSLLWRLTWYFLPTIPKMQDYLLIRMVFIGLNSENCVYLLTRLNYL